MQNNIKKQLLNFPEQFNWEPKIKNKKNLPHEWEDILICGMGGSALSGLLLKSLLADKKININKNYDLPKTISKNTLVIVISYSGNTEEALSSYAVAKKDGLQIVAMSSGGMLEKNTIQDGVPFVKIPSGMQPRLAMGYQFRALLELISEKAPNGISIDSEKISENAKKLAQKIGKSTPLFYSSEKNNALAYIAKIQVNENAKRHSFYNVFPELNHNELEAFESPQLNSAKRGGDNFFAIMLKDKSDDKRIQKRMGLTAKIIKEKNYSIETIDISNTNWYNRIIYSVLFTNWLAYYLAIDAGVDPEPVDLIEQFKKEL